MGNRFELSHGFGRPTLPFGSNDVILTDRRFSSSARLEQQIAPGLPGAIEISPA